MKVSQVKRHRGGVHPWSSLFIRLLLIFCFLPFLPLLCSQCCGWRDLQPVCCRKRRGLHRAGCDPAGQTDPDWCGLPTSLQRGPSRSKSMYNSLQDHGTFCSAVYTMARLSNFTILSSPTMPTKLRM